MPPPWDPTEKERDVYSITYFVTSWLEWLQLKSFKNHLESFKSWCYKISYTINMLRSLLRSLVIKSLIDNIFVDCPFLQGLIKEIGHIMYLIQIFECGLFGLLLAWGPKRPILPGNSHSQTTHSQTGRQVGLTITRKLCRIG